MLVHTSNQSPEKLIESMWDYKSWVQMSLAESHVHGYTTRFIFLLPHPQRSGFAMSLDLFHCVSVWDLFQRAECHIFIAMEGCFCDTKSAETLWSKSETFTALACIFHLITWMKFDSILISTEKQSTTTKQSISDFGVFDSLDKQSTFSALPSHSIESIA